MDAEVGGRSGDAFEGVGQKGNEGARLFHILFRPPPCCTIIYYTLGSLDTRLSWRGQPPEPVADAATHLIPNRA